MPHFIRAASAANYNSANQVIWPNGVVVHHRNRESCPSDSLSRNIKHERLVEARIGRFLFCVRLLLLRFFPLVQ